ncbi:MAG: nitrogen fixation protein NifH [Dehalococcoidales bacterium]|nr:nitrogen fixation protein NifH [Dehalococcoidales bacterium]
MGNQQDWKKALKADPTDWLLEEDDPGVRYLGLWDIVDADEKEVQAARRKAHREGPIATILDNMDPEGYWIKPGNVYANKCRGTVWSIISLAELGASIKEDKRIGAACAYLIDQALLKSGQFSPSGKATNMGLCLQGNMLLSLSDLGYKDNRLDTAYEWTARMVTGEGVSRKVNPDGLAPGEGVPGPFRYFKYMGPRFVCRTNKGLPCGWAGAKVMMAFSRLPVERRTGLIKRAIETGIDFFLSGDPSKAEFPGHRTSVPDKRWWQFRFPSFWGADILQIAEALTGLGYGSDPRLANTLKLIWSKQDENGRWPLEYVDQNHKMWVKYGKKDSPNKWVTLRAMRVLKRAGEEKLKV